MIDHPPHKREAIERPNPSSREGVLTDCTGRASARLGLNSIWRATVSEVSVEEPEDLRIMLPPAYQTEEVSGPEQLRTSHSEGFFTGHSSKKVDFVRSQHVRFDALVQRYVSHRQFG